MKRIVICILMLVLIVCGTLAVGAEEVIAPGAIATKETVIEDSRSQWQVVLEDKVFPVMAAVVSGAASVYVLILPVLATMRSASTKVNAAAGLFTNATGGVLKATETSESSNKKIAEFEAALTEERAARLEAEKRFCQMIKVFASVFATDEGLVRSGAAREMMKAVEEYVGKKE